ncbi:hypothetical protein Nepgr_006508 [Nepenthes gracilis]|uniref:Uncharacterized protein n=1 Tax=Nepenthes gracilis TaxID=150966 RepID=A0AAD3S578_NEPGR|nr:hypothetical protein Nepgr_006508 [Nepenthes gracilis]
MKVPSSKRKVGVLTIESDDTPSTKEASSNLRQKKVVTVMPSSSSSSSSSEPGYGMVGRFAGAGDSSGAGGPKHQVVLSESPAGPSTEQVVRSPEEPAAEELLEVPTKPSVT